MKLPLDLKIYAAYLILSALVYPLRGYPEAVAPLGLFVAIGTGAYIHSVVLQIAALLSAIMIISKSPAGWHIAFWTALYGIVYCIIAAVTGSMRTVMTINAAGRALTDKNYQVFLSIAVIVCLAQVAYLLWRRKRFFAVCRAAKSEKSSSARQLKA